MMRLKKQENKYISVYGEIARVLSESEDVEKIYDLLKGQTISFPKKLYSTEYIKVYIHKNYGKERKLSKAQREAARERINIINKNSDKS